MTFSYFLAVTIIFLTISKGLSVILPLFSFYTIYMYIYTIL